MGNSSGSYRSSRENSLSAYDKLPPTARKALQDAAFDWAPQPILTYWRRGAKGYKSGPEIAISISVWDARKIEKERKRVWGIKDDAPRTNARVIARKPARKKAGA